MRNKGKGKEVGTVGEDDSDVTKGRRWYCPWSESEVQPGLLLFWGRRRTACLFAERIVLVGIGSHRVRDWKQSP